MYTKLELWIDGQWRQGSEGKSEPVINPANESVLAELPHASEADLDEALAATDRAFREWRHSNPYKRAALLHKVADLIRDNQEHLAEIMTLEQGKPIMESRLEVGITADSHDWAAEECVRTYGRRMYSRSEVSVLASWI